MSADFSDDHTGISVLYQVVLNQNRKVTINGRQALADKFRNPLASDTWVVLNDLIGLLYGNLYPIIYPIISFVTR